MMRFHFFNNILSTIAFRYSTALFVFCFSIAAPFLVSAQSFTTGNLAVLTIGNGISALTSSATPVSVLEFTTSGVPTGVAVSLPSAGAVKITNSGTATSEGLMGLSAERDLLIVAGYDAASGVNNIASSSSSAYSRVLFSIDHSGGFSKVASTSSAYTGNNIRSGTSFGTNYFAAGPVNGLELMNSSTQLTTSTTNARSIAIFNGQTYFTSDVAPFSGLSALGSGIPLTSGATAVLKSNPSTGSAFAFTISPDGNTLYIADDAAGVLKYTRSGASFNLNYVVNNTGVRGLTADFSGSVPVIYATTTEASANRIIRMTDGGSGSPAVTLATAAANTVFRGIAFSPACTASLSISGLSAICSGDSTTLVLKGNPWASVMYNINGLTTYTATIGNNGFDTIRTGPLTTTSTYNLQTVTTPGCPLSPVAGNVTVTVNPQPAVISGPAGVCTGANILLTNSGGGTWSSSNSIEAAIGSVTGLVAGMAAGVPIITYTLPTGCYTTRAITVNASPDAITGTSELCAGATTSLGETTTGGSWSSGSTGVATIGSGSGVLSGILAGTASITYTASNGCVATIVATVDALPQPVSGLSHLCAGDTTTLVDLTPGGSWTSSNPGVISVDAVTGFATGVAAGNSQIKYTLVSGCYTLFDVTVNPSPGLVSGVSNVCSGDSITLTDAVAGGIWTTANPAVAFPGSASGIVTGIGAGVTQISYTLAGGCAVAYTFTVNAQPGPILGTLTLCQGQTSTLSDPIGAGTWLASNPAVGSVDVSGNVTGFLPGNSTITYVLPGGCYSSATLTVNLSPSPVSGPSNICTGDTAVLSDTTPGGTWSCGSPAIATIGSSTGIVTGTGTGTAILTYALGNGCFQNSYVTFNPQPSGVSGISECCAGSGTSLSDAAPGGVWTSTNPAVATIGSMSGLVTGVLSGVAGISYTLSTGCFTTITVTVHPLPSAITGPATICAALPVVFTDSVAGGSWQSSDVLVANVGSVTGMVAGVMAGNATITYSIGPGCVATKNITVNTTPVLGAISGASSVCTGATTSLSDTAVSGLWGCSNSHATVSPTGVVHGVSAGSDTVFYSKSNTCGITTVSLNVLVKPLPDSGIISGPGSVCAGASVLLTESVAGGVWSEVTGAATISSGTVTGTAKGTDTCIYTVINSCGVAHASKIMVIDSLPDPGIISGPGSVCTGALATMTESVAGGVWSTSNTHASIASGNVTGVTAGTDTVLYAVTNSCGTTIAGKSITVNASPVAGPISGPSVLCQGGQISLTDATGGGSWRVVNSKLTVQAGTVTGVSGGVDTVVYSVTTTCGTAKAFYTVTINPLPDPGRITGPPYLCINSIDTLKDSVTGGVWRSFNDNASIQDGVIEGLKPGVDTFFYIVSNHCGLDSARHPVTIQNVEVKPVITRKYNVLSLDTTYAAYQWLTPGTPIPYATKSTYTMPRPDIYLVIVTGEYGCQGWASLEVRNLNCDPASIGIFPNPTSRYMHFTWCANVNIRLSSSDGAVTRVYYNVNQIDLADLPPGNYLLCFFDEDGNILRTTRITRLPY